MKTPPTPLQRLTAAESGVDTARGFTRGAMVAREDLRWAVRGLADSLEEVIMVLQTAYLDEMYSRRTDPEVT